MTTLKAPRSAVFFVRELEKARDWYAEVLDILPYRDDKDFVGFHLDGCDLCFHSSDEKSGEDGASVVVYWVVDNLEELIAHFISYGATLYRKPIEIIEGGRVAQIQDPFRNILGLTEK
jgi:predicted enzyme related to lactoylglutathione lyase